MRNWTVYCFIAFLLLSSLNIFRGPVLYLSLCVSLIVQPLSQLKWFSCHRSDSRLWIIFELCFFEKQKIQSFNLFLVFVIKFDCHLNPAKVSFNISIERSCQQTNFGLIHLTQFDPRIYSTLSVVNSFSKELFVQCFAVLLFCCFAVLLFCCFAVLSVNFNILLLTAQQFFQRNKKLNWNTRQT